MSELSDWPACAVCSDRVRMSTEHPEDQGAWCPVEEVERVNETPSVLYRARFYIIAKCSHGGGREAHFAGRVQVARSEAILVPHWCTPGREADAVKTLCFFGRELRPAHRLVSVIGL